MRVDGINGEVFSKALVKPKFGLFWKVTDMYFTSLEDVKTYCGTGVEVRFPVDIIADGVIIVEDPNEQN